MDTHEKAMAQHLRELLQERAKQLGGVLSAAEGVPDASDEVHDFKDAAAREALDEVDEARSALAAQELALVRDGLRRLDDGSYGTCMDCGGTIPGGRLLAMPTARYCIACELARERGAAA